MFGHLIYHFKGLGMRNLQYETRICQKIHQINFPKELDLVIRDMKKTTLEPQKCLSLEEPLDF